LDCEVEDVVEVEEDGVAVLVLSTGVMLTPVVVAGTLGLLGLMVTPEPRVSPAEVMFRPEVALGLAGVMETPEPILPAMID